jgi:hypothetical protein
MPAPWIATQHKVVVRSMITWSDIAHSSDAIRYPLWDESIDFHRPLQLVKMYHSNAISQESLTTKYLTDKLNK